MPDPKKSAEQAGKEFEEQGGLEEGGGGAGEGGSQEGGSEAGAGGQELDDEAYIAKAEKEGLKSVPYDRFSKVHKTAKERKADAEWRKEHEPKYKELQGYPAQLEFLGKRLAGKPYLQNAVKQLLESEDGSLNEQELLDAITEALKGKSGAGAGDDKSAGSGAKPLDEAKIIEKVMATVQEQNEIKEIQAEINATFDRLPKLAALPEHKADFEGVAIDEAFVEEVEQQLKVMAREGKTGKSAKDGVIQAAKVVAARHQAIMDRVLKRQVENGGKKVGAGTIASKGASGGAKPKVPDRHTDPDGFERYKAQVAANFAKENGLDG